MSCIFRSPRRRRTRPSKDGLPSASAPPRRAAPYKRPAPAGPWRRQNSFLPSMSDLRGPRGMAHPVGRAETAGRAAYRHYREGRGHRGITSGYLKGKEKRRHMPPLPFCCFVPGAGGRIRPLFFSSCRRVGTFRAPGRGVFLANPCQERFRAPARGPFGAAQKGRKGRLGAAAPKNPIDVQWSALFSFRRVDIALPLRPLPGLPLR